MGAHVIGLVLGQRLRMGYVVAFGLPHSFASKVKYLHTVCLLSSSLLDSALFCYSFNALWFWTAVWRGRRRRMRRCWTAALGVHVYKCVWIWVCGRQILLLTWCLTNKQAGVPVSITPRSRKWILRAVQVLRIVARLEWYFFCRSRNI